MTMMSREERRRLAAIERQMLIDDPALAQLFTRSLRCAGSTLRTGTAAVVGLLFALAAIAGLIAGSSQLVATTAALLVAAAWTFRLTRHSAS